LPILPDSSSCRSPLFFRYAVIPRATPIRNRRYLPGLAEQMRRLRPKMRAKITNNAIRGPSVVYGARLAPRRMPFEPGIHCCDEYRGETVARATRYDGNARRSDAALTGKE